MSDDVTTIDDLEQITWDQLGELPAITRIEDVDDEAVVASGMNRIADIRKRWKASVQPAVDAAHKAHKAALAHFKELDEPLGKKEREYRNLLADYRQRLEKERAAEQRKLDEDAKKKALAEANKEGDKRLVKDIEKGTVPVASTVVVETPKAEGVSYRSKYTARIVDEQALVKAVAAGKQPWGYITINTSALDKLMQATKGQAEVPGVVAVEDKVVVKGRV